MRKPPAVASPSLADLAPTRLAEIAMLSEAIRRSGLSMTQYAERVLVRDERTVRRWLKGERQIPRAVLEALQRGAAA